MPDTAHLTTICKTYLAQIEKQKKLPNSTDEMSYRDYLGAFLRQSGAAVGKDVQWTGEAKKLKVGRPDYEVTDGLTVYGYVEAESIVADLDNLKGSAKEQNARFQDNLHCVLLTNHTAFHLYVDGKRVEQMEFSTVPTPEQVSAWEKLLSRFLNEAVPHAHSAEEVARQLAKRAKDLRLAASVILSQENSPLHAFWNAYRTTLYEDLPADKFADIYAQTFVYGLFLAWLSHDKGPFTRFVALESVPDIVPPVAALLDAGGGKKLPDELLWIVNGVCSDLFHADKEAALKPFRDGRDPIMHFYETFLAAYDETLRKSRGVYYTPDHVVEFIVRAVDDLLQTHFGKQGGLADTTVTLLDPAVGTGTFLAHAVRHVKNTLTDKEQGGLWQGRAENHIARHFFGFELLPAAYTLAHIKIRSLLKELGAPLPDKVRLPIYLTNTLDEGIPHGDNLPFVETLREESEYAAKIKTRENVLVVLGNPPYSGHSANSGKNKDGTLNHIGRLVNSYYFVDGKPLGEKNPKWLQDDYVKFLRFAEDRINRSGSGIVAFITNHGYLDNPTFRGLRRHLMNTFDLLYLYDLHGNSKKKETNPTGGPDENVFDIQQGVAICLLVKFPGGKGKAGEEKNPPAPLKGGDGVEILPIDTLSSPFRGNPSEAGKGVHPVPLPKMFHADLYGERSHKYKVLGEQTVKGVAWNEIVPTAPFYLFAPQDETVRAEYEAGWSVVDIFPVNSVGIVTGQDKKTIAFTESEAESLAAALNVTKEAVTPILYRPFDTRYIVYDKSVVTRQRLAVMRHILAGSIGLITSRMTKGEDFHHVQVTQNITEVICMSPLTSNNGFVFPLYIYPTASEKEFGMEKHANLNPEFVSALENNIGTAATPQEIFGYIYALLHSPTYRQRYGEFLRRDFPRIPLPPTETAFRWGVNAGNALIGTHLLTRFDTMQTGIGFPHAGNNKVGKMRPAERFIAGRIRLNTAQNFTNVPEDVWTMRVGGYLPAQKWLDDRTERTLSDDDLLHYMKLLAALRETLALLPACDAVFDAVLENAPPTLQ